MSTSRDGQVNCRLLASIFNMDERDSAGLPIGLPGTVVTDERVL